MIQPGFCVQGFPNLVLFDLGLLALEILRRGYLASGFRNHVLFDLGLFFDRRLDIFLSSGGSALAFLFGASLRLEGGGHPVKVLQGLQQLFLKPEYRIQRFELRALFDRVVFKLGQLRPQASGHILHVAIPVRIALGLLELKHLQTDCQATGHQLFPEGGDLRL